MLILRIVTKGSNSDAVRRTVQACSQFPCKIQVISDIPIKDCPHVFVVPKTFKPKNGAKWKARALEWAKRKQDDSDWVLHLDEESIPTIECIKGCADFMRTHTLSIGQGEILYNGTGYNPWKATCAADSLRTGDDIFRFRFQYSCLHVPIFGSHGSFLLVPGILERKIGWDVGASGSVTEDAAFAITAWGRGIRFDWVNGQMIEQSPYTFLDFIKQRRRWFNGLWFVATSQDFPIRYRAVLGLFMAYWSISPFVLLFCIAMWAFAIPMPWMISLFLRASFVYYVASYAIGGWRNGNDVGLIASLISLPRSFFYEACGVLYGLFKPVRTFEVVEKN